MAAAARARLGAALLLLAAQAAGEYGMLRAVGERGGRGRDYCVLYNPQWAPLPREQGKASLLQLRDWSASTLCGPGDVPARGFPGQAPLVARGNCTFYDKARRAQAGGARALLVVSRGALVPPGGNQSQYEEIGIPVALLSHEDALDMFQTLGPAVRGALLAPGEPLLDYSMAVIFLLAVGTVALGGYWAGSRDGRRRGLRQKRDAEPEKREDEALDVTPLMAAAFVLLCCTSLLLLYRFYDQLVYAIIAVFCLASAAGLYNCLQPLVGRLPLCTCRLPPSRLPGLHARPRLCSLLLAAFCAGVSVLWGICRNQDQWAWALQDVLGVAFCLHTLRTVRLPSFKACTLLLTVLFVYDVFFVFITPFLTESGSSIMVEVATGPAGSVTQEKLPMVLKVPRLGTSPLALCRRPFSLLGFGDILVPGLLVAYCHRFDVHTRSARVYFLTCTLAYGVGLLLTLAALAAWRRGQPALLYLVPCSLGAALLQALRRRELRAFWAGGLDSAKDSARRPGTPPAEGPRPRLDAVPDLQPGERLPEAPAPGPPAASAQL